MSVPQHMKALAIGNDRRLKRAKHKAHIRAAADRPASFLRAAQLIAANPPEVVNMTIFELITACRSSGPTTARRMCSALQISEARTLGQLTQRQRATLMTAFGVPVPTASVEAEPIPALPPVIEEEATYCPRCESETVTNKRGGCAWCDAKLEPTPVAS